MPDAPTIADVLERLDKLAARLDAGPQRFLTVDGAAAYSGLSAKSIRRLIARGELQPHRPVRGRVLIDRQQLDAVVLSSKTEIRRGRGRPRAVG